MSYLTNDKCVCSFFFNIFLNFFIFIVVTTKTGWGREPTTKSIVIFKSGSDQLMSNFVLFLAILICKALPGGRASKTHGHAKFSRIFAKFKLLNAELAK